MVPPLLRVLLDEPRLAIEYASAYTALLKQDASRWHAQQMRRFAYLLTAVAGIVLAVAFAGVALMLSAVTGSSHWMLWVVPALPLTVAIAASWQVRHTFPPRPAFPRVRAQVARDMQLFDPHEGSNDESRA